MSNKGPHIVDVQLQGVPLQIAEALESEGLSALAGTIGLGAVTGVR